MQNFYTFTPASYNKYVPIGFTRQEIDLLNQAMQCGFRPTPNNFTIRFSLPYELASRVAYLYKIHTGVIDIRSDSDLSKHLRRLYGGHGRIGITDLPLSRVQRIPRLAVIDGITDPTFSFYNSRNFKGANMLYRVLGVSSKNVIITTSKRPALRYRQEKVIPDVIEMQIADKSKTITLKVNKKYCRLCNRFVIVAGLRPPEFHHMMYSIICFEGTTVYIYAKTVGVREEVQHNQGTQRVYAWGVKPNEMKVKMQEIAKEIYRKVRGVKINYIPANQEYSILDIERQDLNYNDEGYDEE